jgi:hypothetical protein
LETGEKHMTDYLQMLFNICFTMITMVIVMGGAGTLIFIGLAIWNMVSDHFD